MAASEGEGEVKPVRVDSRLAMQVRHGLAMVAALSLLVPSIATGSARPSGVMTSGVVAAPRAPLGALAPSVMTATSGSPRHAPAQALPFLTLDPGKLRAAKLRAAARASVGSRHPLAAAPLPDVGLFNGLNKPGLSDYLVTPPDSTGSIGPSNYMEMVNQQVGVYDRNLDLVSSTDLTSFVAANGWTVSDPQVQWDAQGQRWLYAAVGIAGGNNVLLFGWSKTPSPTDLVNGWCRFGIFRQHLLDDYPKLGHDDGFVLVGSNVYDDTNAPDYQFLTATVWAIPKPEPDANTCVAPPNAYFFADGANPLLNADGSPAFTPVPANTAEAASVGYIVAAHFPGTAPFAPKVMVWHVEASGGAPSLVADEDVSVGAFDIPAPAPQPGSSLKLDTLDARLTQAVARTDPAAGGLAVWTQHTIAGPGGRSVVRWYEIVPSAGAALRQEGEISSQTDFVFNGAISSTGAGDGAALFYNRGGTAQLPVIGALSRSAQTPLGTMEPGELLLGTSSTVDQDFSCSAGTPCRWGDYAGASPDPVNPNVVWGSSQVTGPCIVFCGFLTQWQTRNFAVEVAAEPPPPPTPPSAPQSLTATGADASVTLNWAAPASDGGSPVTDYTVYRGTSPGSEVLIASSGGALTYTDTGLTNGQPYYYVVHAVNVVDEGPASNEVSATPVGTPSAPQSLTATGADASVTLNWLAPSSDGGSQVTDYTVYRGTSPGSEVLLASSGGALTYTDTGLTNGQPYYYVVHAVNGVGEGPASNEASATPQPSVTPPSAPRNLAVAPFRPHGLRLTWLAPLTDGGSEVTAYQIWRGTAPGAETLYVTVGTVTDYTDAGATNKRVRYYYVVRAVNTVGAGPPSNEVNALGR